MHDEFKNYSPPLWGKQKQGQLELKSTMLLTVLNVNKQGIKVIQFETFIQLLLEAASQALIPNNSKLKRLLSLNTVFNLSILLSFHYDRGHRE